MAEKMEFDYYYGSQAEQFSFYRLPKSLIKDKQFKRVSSDAKILYGIMLDRMSLSIKNRWVDGENRVYIIFTLEDVMNEFECSERKASYLMSELDTKSGIGLIEKKRQGLGKPNLIYLKNFLVQKDYSYLSQDNDVPEATGEVLQIQSCKNMQEQSGKDMQIKTGTDMQVQSCKNLQVKSCKNVQVKGSTDMQVQSSTDLQNKICNSLPPSYTNINDTDNSETTVNKTMVATYWTVGKKLYEVQSQTDSTYGKKLISYSSKKLTEEFGKGFDERNLRNMRQFYKTFQKWNTVCSELSWSHYRLLMRIQEEEKRQYYIKECVECAWGVRQLERQINSFYYERILATSEGKKAEVRNEIQMLEPDRDPKHLLKDPYILEFLGMEENKAYLEQELEQGLIDNLQSFLLELGKGFCFVARQKRITLDGDHYYIDLVFYNYILKCFVLIDLKTHKLSYQDIGQIDFYVKYFEENIKTEGDNPTIGIVLCSEKNETMVKYSVLNENDHLYASKYKLYIPSEEELKKEIERERFNLEQKLEDNKK